MPRKTIASKKRSTKPKKATASKKGNSVKVGNISGVSGNVNVAGGNITTHHTVNGLNAADIKNLFDGLYTSIESHEGVSAADKKDLKADVEEIQSIVTKAVKENEKIDETFLARRFRSIAKMAPDILDVVVATVGNPLAGLGVAVKMITDKAKEA